MRRAVAKLLDDAEWAKWSDREIARRCGVSDRFVNGMRPAPSANGSQIPRKVERGGTVYTQNTSNIGKRIVTKAEYESMGDGELVDPDTGEVFEDKSRPSQPQGIQQELRLCEWSPGH